MQILIHLAAFGLLVSLMSYFVALTLAHFRSISLAKKTAELERSYLRARIDQIMDLRGFERTKNELSWNGFRKFQVVRKVDEGGNVCSFYLTPHDRKPLPPYQPGQYLTFQLNVPGQAKPVVRCYSLSDSPNHPDYYRVSIKKCPAPRDKPEIPPGLVSNYFHDHVKEGDILDVKAPAGHFFLDLAKQTPIVLIGGGIGITPVLSMLNAVIEAGSKREVWFFFGVRNRSEHVMKEHLARVHIENQNVRMNVCYSDPTDKDVRGTDYHQAERVSVALFKKLLPSNNFDFYICGPPPMMQQLTQDLKDWGVPDTCVFFEAFGPASVKKLAPAAEAAGQSKSPAAGVKITFAKTGKTFSWNPEAGSLLDFAEANGVAMNSGCRAGNCGTCLTAIKEGEVECKLEHGAKPEAGSCLACISAPKTDLVLDA